MSSMPPIFVLRWQNCSFDCCECRHVVVNCPLVASHIIPPHERRCAMFVPLVLLLALPGAEPNDAEKIFRQMEEKVMKAKSVECAGEMKAEIDADGTIQTLPRKYTLCAEGNKGRMEMTIGSGTHKIIYIADGTKMATAVDGKSEEPKDNPKFSEVLRAQI